ncbi:hypothetical protein FRX31_025363 [Thalictrum thalictroides]|uniref:Uncharacterized protein n=1 Tax=Thalictrum thalictroides TaxID=46969 RepID=A0A7J6VLP9_THATH|nr:hypothetical protein FRX31_025363 [Thalictrum thalictroides]
MEEVDLMDVNETHGENLPSVDAAQARNPVTSAFPGDKLLQWGSGRGGLTSYSELWKPVFHYGNHLLTVNDTCVSDPANAFNLLSHYVLPRDSEKCSDLDYCSWQPFHACV